MAKKIKDKIELDKSEITTDEIKEIKEQKAEEQPKVEIKTEVVPKGFVNQPKENVIGTRGIRDGRVYEIINQYYAMYCDDGQCFSLDEIK